MNCKPGDLAVIVRSCANNHGRLVHVIGPQINAITSSLGYRPQDGHLWHVHSLRPLRSSTGWLDTDFAVPDAWLRPIRDNDGQDETLTWVPRKVPA